jgi:hypothetical protein
MLSKDASTVFGGNKSFKEDLIIFRLFPKAVLVIEKKPSWLFTAGEGVNVR